MNKLSYTELSYLSNETEDMELVETAYEIYKKAWAMEHISQKEFTATFASYENNADAKDMSFREYVEEYGFSNGECYVSLSEFEANEGSVWMLASEIEDFLWERGEYDHPADKTIRWINSDEKTCETARYDTTSTIVAALENGEIQPIINYIQNTMAVLEEDDELTTAAKEILENLKSADLYYTKYGTLYRVDRD